MISSDLPIELKAPPSKPVGFQFHVKNWLGDHCVMAMSYAERGMHLHLMCVAWQETPPCTLPQDDEKLAHWLGLSTLAWVRIHKNKVMAAWKSKTEDGITRWVQDGTQRSYEKQVSVLAARQAAALTRWRKDVEIVSNPSELTPVAPAFSPSVPMVAPKIEVPLKEDGTVDLTAQIWAIGLMLLTPQYESKESRRLIGRWIKQYGEVSVASVLSELSLKAHTVADRYTYVTAALSNHAKGNQVRKAPGRGDMVI
jgi:Protein of unknown function (DUF1376)